MWETQWNLEMDQKVYCCCGRRGASQILWYNYTVCRITCGKFHQIRRNVHITMHSVGVETKFIIEIDDGTTSPLSYQLGGEIISQNQIQADCRLWHLWLMKQNPNPMHWNDNLVYSQAPQINLQSLPMFCAALLRLHLFANRHHPSNQSQIGLLKQYHYYGWSEETTGGMGKKSIDKTAQFQYRLRRKFCRCN